MPVKLVETRHFQISQDLRAKFSACRPNHKLPTMKELEQEYGASRVTIERALDRLRKDRLIYRPSGRQRYVVAEHHDRALRRVALVRPDWPSRSLDAICRLIAEAGKADAWRFDMVSFRDMSSLDLEYVAGDSDAVVFIPTSEPFPPHVLDSLRHPSRRPVVVVQEHVTDPAICNVCADDQDVGAMAVRYLAERGHRRIVAVIDQPRVSSIEARLAGWRRAMAEIGVADVGPLILDCGVRSGQDALQASYERFSNWFDGSSRPEFSGMVTLSPAGAMAALRRLGERGVGVPDPVSIVSYGGEGSLCAFTRPPLTTVEVDLDAYGREVIDMLETSLSGGSVENTHRLLTPDLIERKTVGPYCGCV